MQTLEELYKEVVETPSDIHEHLETFVDMVIATGARDVIELGVRGCVSTIAWLYALDVTDGHLWSVDIDPPKRWFGVQPRWTFVLGDDMNPDTFMRVPSEADIVFIDTSHAYQHTLNELNMYGGLVRPGGVILLHDTEVQWPELVDDGVEYPVKRAVRDYCRDNELEWTNQPHCNGLGIIRM